MAASHTILLIDDDTALCELYRVKFERAGFRVVIYGDAAAALEALKGDLHPDLIVLDIILPGMDGFAFLRGAKQASLHLPPVIVLTNQDTDVVKEEAFALGANNYIAKASETPKEILEHIIEILRTQEAITGS